MKSLLPFLFVVLATSTIAVAGGAPKVGESAPQFTVKDTNGKSHSLADYKGKHVVLEWLNHDCPFVVKHYQSKNMQTLQKTATEKGVVWLSIISSAPGNQGSATGEAVNKLTTEKGAAPTAVLLDSEGTAGRSYEAKTTPHMFVINPEGTLVYKGAIDSISSTQEADVPKATNYVKAALEESMAGKPVGTSSSKPYGCSVKY